MATFKVTIDENSELGIHIGKLSPRGRSREIYMLASMGLMSRSSGPNLLPNQVGVLNAEETPGVALKASVDDAGGSDLAVKNQPSIIDYGDDLMKL
jgi:hypothetical protein